MTDPDLFDPSAVIGPRTTLYLKREPGTSWLWRMTPHLEVSPLDPMLGERLIRGLQSLGSCASEPRESTPAYR